MNPYSPLGEFEITVLMAALRLPDEATGSRVRDEIERLTHRQVARGAVYVTLDRLESKKLVASRQAPAAPGRGGRPRRIYRVQPAGVRAIERSLTAIEQMRAGLNLVVDRP
jgi:DNA-binding PadR family transcriptional regulator